jgi:hypothetical protein
VSARFEGGPDALFGLSYGLRREAHDGETRDTGAHEHLHFHRKGFGADEGDR